MSLSDMCLSDMGLGKVKDLERGLRGLQADDDVAGDCSYEAKGLVLARDG